MCNASPCCPTLQAILILTLYCILAYVPLSSPQKKKDCWNDRRMKTKCNRRGECVVTEVAETGVLLGQCNCTTPGYGGQLCDIRDKTDCRIRSRVCTSNGRCEEDPENLWFHNCFCSQGYTGSRCESTIEVSRIEDDDFFNPCKSFPCKFGGTCVKEQPVRYRCQCTMYKKIYPRTAPNCARIDLANPEGKCKNTLCAKKARCKTMEQVLKKLQKTWDRSNSLQTYPNDYSLGKMYDVFRENQMKIFSRGFLTHLRHLTHVKMCLCPIGKRGHDCSQDCPKNYYGEGCFLQCNIGCYNGCRSDTGECFKCLPDPAKPQLRIAPEGVYCLSPYTGRFCETKMPNLNDQCDPTGLYHWLMCEHGGKCEDKGGYHVCECKPGWARSFCREKCEEGLYGANCFRRCGRCAVKSVDMFGVSVCDIVTGKCPVFNGQRCEHPKYKEPYCVKKRTKAVRVFYRMTAGLAMARNILADLFQRRKSYVDSSTDESFSSEELEDGAPTTVNQTTVKFRRRMLDEDNDQVLTLEDFKLDVKTKLLLNIVQPINKNSNETEGEVRRLNISLVFTHTKRHYRNTRQLSDSTIQGIQVQADLLFVATLSDDLKEVKQTMVKYADQIKPDLVPGLTVDISSISVTQVHGDYFADPTISENIWGLPDLLPVLIAVVVLSVVLLAILYKSRKIKQVSQARTNIRYGDSKSQGTFQKRMRQSRIDNKDKSSKTGRSFVALRHSKIKQPIMNY